MYKQTKELLEEYISKYYRKYYEVIDDLTNAVFKDLINTDNFLYYNPEKQIIISLIDEDREITSNVSRVNDIDVGIYRFLSTYSNSSLNQNHKGILLSTFKTASLSSLLIYIDGFTNIIKTKEYLELFKYYQDFWLDYISILLSAPIKFLDDIPTDKHLLEGKFKNKKLIKELKITKRWAEINQNNGLLQFVYTYLKIGEETEENKFTHKDIIDKHRGVISFMEPKSLFKVINNYLLRNP